MHVHFKLHKSNDQSVYIIGFIYFTFYITNQQLNILNNIPLMMLFIPRISLIIVISIFSYVDNNTGFLEVEIKSLKSLGDSITLDPNETPAIDLAFNVILLQAFRFLILQIHLLAIFLISLSHCTQLTKLSLFENSLLGPIPPELGNLKRLQYSD
ncbi:hypothetical protein S245_029048 [Arachis hypogaea]